VRAAVQDLLVIETAGVLAGPLVGQFFAELGARVVKVENPRTGGDVTRSWRTAGESPQASRTAYFCAANWGKAGIALDLGVAPQRGVLLDLLQRADIWIDNFLPGSLERLGIDAAQVRRDNPGLIHARIEAYGPGDERPGYDAALQAQTGLMSINGTADSGPLKLPLAMVDILAAHQLKEGVLLALWERERTGRGGTVSASLYDSGVACLANQATNFLVTGQVPRPMGSGHPSIAPYGTAFDCSDGKPVVLAVGNDRQFAALCAALGKPALAAAPEFATNGQRVLHRERLEALLGEAVARVERDPFLARLERLGVPAAPVLSVQEALSTDLAAPLLLHDPATGRAGLRTAVFALAAGDDARVELRPPPALDQDAEEVLVDILGHAPDSAARFLAAASADESGAA
jgi:crotonobetainyl-CoA:carnitine CoA-transferase CaiB-like acyl-CoA transferase